MASAGDGQVDSRGRVLVVEDDADVRGALVALLEDEGLLVESVPTAERALEAIAARPFSFLLTDYNLPGKNGSWLAGEVCTRGLLPATQILLMSAAIKVEVPAGVSFLSKPLDSEALIGSIARGLRRAAGSDSADGQD